MNVLSFDPSSTATGWALMPLDGGVVPVCSGVLRRPEDWNAALRLGCLSHDLSRLFAALSGRFDRLVVEVPGVRQAGRKRAEYATSGVYAMAVGVVVGAGWSLGLPVVSVASDHWTRLGGRYGVPKPKRLEHLRCMGAYDGKNDPGGDRGDAIYLGHWFAVRCGSLTASECPLFMPEPVSGVVRWCDIVRQGDGPAPIGARFMPEPLPEFST